MIWLAIAFFATALLYASVGFGGGSTYSALLALAGLDYRVLPLVSLACNIVVVAGSTIRFSRAGILPWRRALVLTGLAAPAALLGGLTPIGERNFLLLLGASLVMTGLTLLIPVAKSSEEHATKAARFAPLAAPPLGYLAGLVGIGGGIFLAPLLHLVRWAEAKSIAATAALFILVNSLFGLVGQILKGGEGRFEAAVGFGLPLLVAVAIGGQIGSYLVVRFLPQRWIRWITAGLTLFVGVRLVLDHI
ncbi:sulfite exporter TauE/SafE family protein [Erythrobacter sp. A6_0]|uniref:sulfite exporter TauE/SafE family protein n=1 Tax=Erythrobacter sp. A6_0 TaxID=2821089 RepID=UPI001ADA5D8F|nr:sulfite exporter TauE/SafE family protein [Erythrobacter sp. A6_0]MBO9510828.1 sulfite exporter TauE/SafE family protein [Erythrobacter sp. A6_0]